jgi:hypothetical protein
MVEWFTASPQWKKQLRKRICSPRAVHMKIFVDRNACKISILIILCIEICIPTKCIKTCVRKYISQYIIAQIISEILRKNLNHYQKKNL